MKGSRSEMRKEDDDACSDSSWTTDNGSITTAASCVQERKLRWPDGSVYVGEVNEHYRPHGYGRLVRDGMEYEGEWNDGRAEGEGSLVSPCWGSFTGCWRGDKINGWGRLVFHDGAVYEGEWVDDRPEGLGVFINPAGIMFRGRWSRGVFQPGESGYDSRGIQTCVRECDSYTGAAHEHVHVQPNGVPSSTHNLMEMPQPVVNMRKGVRNLETGAVAHQSEVFESAVYPEDMSLTGVRMDTGYLYRTNYYSEVWDESRGGTLEPRPVISEAAKKSIDFPSPVPLVPETATLLENPVLINPRPECDTFPGQVSMSTKPPLLPPARQVIYYTNETNTTSSATPQAINKTQRPCETPSTAAHEPGRTPSQKKEKGTSHEDEFVVAHVAQLLYDPGVFEQLSVQHYTKPQSTTCQQESIFIMDPADAYRRQNPFKVQQSVCNHAAPSTNTARAVAAQDGYSKPADAVEILPKLQGQLPAVSTYVYDTSGQEAARENDEFYGNMEGVQAMGASGEGVQAMAGSREGVQAMGASREGVQGMGVSCNEDTAVIYVKRGSVSDRSVSRASGSAHEGSNYGGGYADMRISEIVSGPPEELIIEDIGETGEIGGFRSVHSGPLDEAFSHCINREEDGQVWDDEEGNEWKQDCDIPMNGYADTHTDRYDITAGSIAELNCSHGVETMGKGNGWYDEDQCPVLVDVGISPPPLYEEEQMTEEAYGNHEYRGETYLDDDYNSDDSISVSDNGSTHMQETVQVIIPTSTQQNTHYTDRERYGHRDIIDRDGTINSRTQSHGRPILPPTHTTTFKKIEEVPEPVHLVIPVPTEVTTRFQFKLPKIRVSKVTVDFPVYAPHVVEVPVPAETLSAQGIQLCNEMQDSIRNLAEKKQTATSLEQVADDIVAKLEAAKYVYGSHVVPLEQVRLDAFH